MPDATGESLLLSELATIDRIVAFVRVRNHLSSEDADEFASHVKLRLVENDYAILRKFEGRSSLRTYLTVVIQRLFLDYRTSAWGKWRPSAEARRLGELAILVERLTTRDGYSPDEVHELLTTNHGVTISRADLERLIAKLPSRTRRTFEGEESLAHLPDREPTPERALAEQGRATVMTRVNTALGRALAGLEPQDQLIVRMRYHDGRSVAEIGSALHLDQKALYRRFERLLKGLRRSLESEGVDAEEIIGVLEAPRPEFGGYADTKSVQGRPSITVGAQE
jgi:RNA polymerase sigma factor for flagellar operon FliA